MARCLSWRCREGPPHGWFLARAGRAARAAGRAARGLRHPRQPRLPRGGELIAAKLAAAGPVVLRNAAVRLVAPAAPLLADRVRRRPARPRRPRGRGGGGAGGRVPPAPGARARYRRRAGWAAGRAAAFGAQPRRAGGPAGGRRAAPPAPGPPVPARAVPGADAPGLHQPGPRWGAALPAPQLPARGGRA